MLTARRTLAVRLVLFLTCVAGLGVLVSAQESPARSAATEGSFDAWLKKEIVDRGPSPYYDPRRNVRNELSCFFYPSFVVKQYDEGQKGSEWLAIAPVTGRTPPPCAMPHGAGERVITPEEWSGYFQAAKRRLVFFTGQDGTNEGMPFVVYDSTNGTKVFEDSYHDPSIFNRKADSSPFNHMRIFEGKNEQFYLKYLRVVEAHCDLHLEKSSCWNRVRKRLELQTTQMPVCARYEGVSTRWESAVVYPVEVTLFPKPVIKAISGPVSCWPTD